MINKKHIVIAAVLAILGTCYYPALADNTNSLLQMDVKKSSLADTVDVTFYTTGEMSNSVVSRKANNRYVVLLPNVSSTASVAPGFGAVKDLITDINVKHVNDGMGGYTKVTFATTKPINIKTHTKRTAPLTQAQKDYREILAKNNTTKPAAAQQTKPQAAVAKTAVKDQVKPAAKTETKAAEKPVSNTKKSENTPKISLLPVKTTQKAPQVKTEQPAPKAQAPKTVQPKTEPQKVQPKAPVVNDSYVPKMKFDENGKRMIDLEPRVSHKVVTETETSSKTVTDPIFNVDNPEQTPALDVSQTPSATAVETPQAESNSSHSFPWWMLIAGTSVVAIGILYLVFDAFANSTRKDKTRLQSFFNMSSQNQAKRRRREYYDIVNNEELTWQEKYKLYSEKEEKRKIKKAPMDMSYVTDLSGAKKAVIEPVQPKEKEVKATDSKPLKLPQEDFKSKFNEKMQAKISQMEHALSQTPSVKEPEEVSNEVRSEDNAITAKISDIKLKSFSKSISLKETHRTLAEDDKKLSRNKSYNEGRFVKLKNSPLSVSRRKSEVSGLEVTDLIGTGSKYLTNNGEVKMSKENENYLLSSLDEYLSILDSEAEKKATAAGSLAQLKSPSMQPMTRSGVTNPISRSSNPVQPSGGGTPYMNGLIVKSGYNIDSEKGFYVVNIDGVSALVGRIKDNIFILKKFDHVVDKPIQVRPDDGSVYIVRVGKFKCLVDVAKDKMGTLIEI